MPKKPTKTRERNLASKVVAGEGAPPPSAFSLADFMTALPAKQGGQDTLPAAPKEQDFPSLSASKPPNVSSTATAWTRPPPQPQVKTSPEEPVNVISAESANASPAIANASPVTAPYSIGKTKKGGLPVRVESRSKGKKVTVVFNVTGDLKLLLSELKQAAGSGGVVREDTIEIQGDKQQFVENFIAKKMKKK